MIELARVAKRFGREAAVDDLSFNAPGGAITGFVGPNGAGKSTVLRMIAGLIRPDSGTIGIDGEVFPSAPRPASMLGIFISPEWLPPRATPRGLLEYVCLSQGLSPRLGRNALGEAGLDRVATKRIRELSLGTRQRLGIVAATVAGPRTLLLDEPMSGLDQDGIAWLRELLFTVSRTGATVLISSHDLGELAQSADHIVLIAKGALLAEGSLSDLAALGGEEQIYVECVDRDLLVERLRQNGFEYRASGNSGLLITGGSAEEIGQLAFKTGAGLRHLSTSTRSLEQVYRDITRRGKGR